MSWSLFRQVCSDIRAVLPYWVTNMNNAPIVWNNTNNRCKAGWTKKVWGWSKNGLAKNWERSPPTQALIYIRFSTLNNCNNGQEKWVLNNVLLRTLDVVNWQIVYEERQSKRQSLHKKYKVERKVREHKRKLRKESKTHPELRSKIRDQIQISKLLSNNYNYSRNNTPYN